MVLVFRLLFLVILLAPHALYGATAPVPYKVKEINPNHESSGPSKPVTMDNGLSVFEANDYTHGSELWVTDGTPGGTSMIVDKEPGTDSWAPRYFCAVGNYTYFVAKDQLWRTDGTADGTELVKDKPSAAQFFPVNLTNIDGTLFFVGAQDSNWNDELWVSDGTESGTKQVKDIKPGDQGANPSKIIEFKGKAFFSADDGTNGRELWKSDGTSSGTKMVKNIAANSASSTPTHFTVYNEELYFSVKIGNVGQLWKTSGSNAGTVLVKDFGSNGGAWGFTEHDGLLYFSASDRSTGAPNLGSELWVSDGTSDGTDMLKDIKTGYLSSSPKNFVSMDGFFIFTADTAAHGIELWKSDGTADGTTLLKEFHPGDEDCTFGEFSKLPNGHVLFSASTPELGSELWITDGTSEGTVLVKDIYPGSTGSIPVRFTLNNNKVIFSAEDGAHGAELWVSDGTTDGTILLKDIRVSGQSAEPAFLTDVNGILYFSAEDSQNDKNLWFSDGTEEGTQKIIADTPEDLAAFGNKVIFSASYSRKEPWISDGSHAGTFRIARINPSRGSSPEKFQQVGDRVYFEAHDETHGRELWYTDGTLDSAVFVKDTNPGTAYGNLGYFTELNDIVIFVAGPNYNNDLWRTDGTEDGTYRIKDIRETGNASIGKSIVYKNKAYFRANDGTHGTELWVSDGTEEGTMLFKDINPGAGSSSPYNFCIHNGILYFEAYHEDYGDELWRTDGTVDGTYLVKDINPGTASGNPQDLTSGNFLYFEARTADNGYEIWRSDGTADGTVLLKEIAPGSDSAFASELCTAFGHVFFVSRQIGAETELWMSDGTESGTIKLNPDTDHPLTNIDNLTVSGNHVFFTAYEIRDKGLYAIDISDLNPNQPPVLESSDSVAFSISEDGSPTAFTPPSITVTDPDGDTIHWSVFNDASNGSLVCTGTGSAPEVLTYTPDEDWHGVEYFTIKASDKFGQNVTIDFTITVTSVNDVPVNTTPPYIYSTNHAYQAIIYAQKGSWNDAKDSGTISSYEYQWLRNGTPIPGSNATTHKIVAEDVGQQLSMRVTVYDNNSPSPSSASLETEFVIPTARPLTATAGNQTRGYGTSTLGNDITFSGFFGDDDESIIVGTPAVSTTATANSPQGDYPINIVENSFTAPGYDITFVAGTLSIEQGVLILSADNHVRQTTEPNPNLTYTISGLAPGEDDSVITGTPVLSTTATDDSPEGEYPITIDVSGLSSTNYTFTGVNGTLTISDLTVLTVTALDAERSYGAENAFNFAYSGFEDGDDESIITGTPILSSTADNESSPGTYQITIDVEGLSAEGYIFQGVNGTLTINKAVLTVTADDYTIRAGQDIPPLTYTIDGFVLDQDSNALSGLPTVSTTALSSSPSGLYELTVDTSEVISDNYSLENIHGELIIYDLNAQNITFSGSAREDLVSLSIDAIAATINNGTWSVTLTAPSTDSKDYDLQTEDAEGTIENSTISVETSDVPGGAF